jgi:allantoinase
VFEGRGRLAFPGVVDAHMHAGIYAPLEEDAVSESRAAATGGVTSSLNYFRTGQYYPT